MLTCYAFCTPDALATPSREICIGLDIITVQRECQFKSYQNVIIPRRHKRRDASNLGKSAAVRTFDSAHNMHSIGVNLKPFTTCSLSESLNPS